MSEGFRNKIDLMVSNHRLLKKLVWANGYDRYFIAMYFAQRESEPDILRIKEINRYTKKNTGIFSAFRAESMYFVSALLSTEHDYFSRFQQMLDAYKMLREAGFRTSSYLTAAAYVIASSSSGSEYAQAVNNMRRLFDDLKAAHPLITGYEIYALIAVIAVSSSDMSLVSGRIEYLLEKLKAGLSVSGKRRILLSVCGLLALSQEDPDLISIKFLDAAKLVRAQKVRLEFGSCLTLASICLLRNNAGEDIAQIIENEKYLKNFRGFGIFPLGRELRFSLLGNLLLSETNKPGIVSTAGAATHLIGLIAAQQAATIAASAAAAAVSSSSH